MEVEDHQQGRLEAEGLFSQSVRLLSCCPTLNLLATVSTNEAVDVYRFSGQRAYGAKRRGDNAAVNSICWKYDGMLNDKTAYMQNENK
jgi:hypothetical protein